MRIECETAAQCERIAEIMEPLVVDAVTATVILSVALVVGHYYWTHDNSVP